MEGLNKKYETESLSLDLSGQQFRLMRVTNTDQLYADLVAKGKEHADVEDERIPYWADLWPSALALAMEVMDNQDIKAGTKVLEIGCGLGLPGIAAGMKGASVILSDYMSEPLDFACINWRMNLQTEAQRALLDWRKPDPALAADVLLASDVAYERRSFEFLPHAFQTLVKPGGLILLTEPNRLMASEFFARLPLKGFEVKSQNRTVTLHDRSHLISVYRIGDKSGALFGK
jgi:predicted nicotinamide N-methyase